MCKSGYAAGQGGVVRRSGQLHTVLAAMLALGGACANTAPDAVQALDRDIEVAAGRSVPIGGTDLVVRFVEVTADSLCPTDVQCIAAGDATVVLTTATGGATPRRHELHTADGDREAVHGDFRILVVALRPLPLSTRAIRQGDYVVTIRVSRT